MQCNSPISAKKASKRQSVKKEPLRFDRLNFWILGHEFADKKQYFNEVIFDAQFIVAA